MNSKIRGRYKFASLAIASSLLLFCASGAAAQEALEYLDRSLGSGFRPGMGQLIPDRMFWAQPEEGADAAESGEDTAQTLPELPSAEGNPPPLEGFVMPSHDTKH